MARAAALASFLWKSDMRIMRLSTVINILNLRSIELIYRASALLLGILPNFSMAEGFVDLPINGFPDSAYTSCNATGDFGRTLSIMPTKDSNNNCAIFVPSNNIFRLPRTEGFYFKKAQVRAITMPASHAGIDPNVGTLTDMVWRNVANDQCIYGALLHINDVQFSNGQHWEVNDVTRGGFEGKEAAAAYYFAYHPKGIRSTESVFRIGRTHTSVRHSIGDSDLPSKNDAPAPETAITYSQKAAVSANWVNFTTDLNAKDPDGISFPDGSLMYVKTSCTADPPAEFADAIRLRTTGQNGQEPLEIRIPGFAPSGASMNVY